MTAESRTTGEAPELARESPPAPDPAPRSGARSAAAAAAVSETTADDFRVAIAKGEIRLEFGRRCPPTGSGAAVVTLAAGISMAPQTAQRLLSSLRDAIRDSDRHAPAPAPESAMAQSPFAVLPSNAPPDEAGLRASLLFREVAGLGVPYAQERSFRMTPGSLQANRFLLTVDRAPLGADAAARILAICRRLGMPAACSIAVQESVPQARCIHFGFEEGARGVLFKVYFEHAAAEAEAAANLAGTAVLLHTAYKWPAGAPSDAVVTRYHWYPRLSRAAMLERIVRIYAGSASERSRAIAGSVLDLATQRAPIMDLQYLEVSEEGNERRSFDLNLYEARLQIRDLQPFLNRVREHFDIRPGQYQALYDQIKLNAAGHIAGGVHRDGRDFFTVYHGNEPQQR
jgi:hypothetical protein